MSSLSLGSATFTFIDSGTFYFDDDTIRAAYEIRRDDWMPQCAIEEETASGKSKGEGATERET